jgi:hypothetical protein
MAGRGARTTQLRISISFFILDGLYAVLAASAKEGRPGARPRLAVGGLRRSMFQSQTEVSASSR